MRALKMLLMLVLAVSLAGCSFLAPQTPAEVQELTQSATAAVIVEAFRSPGVMLRFNPADLALVKRAIDEEILPALDGNKPITGAVARSAILAVDRVLADRGSPPLTAITAAVVESVANLIQMEPLDQVLSAKQLAALRGFFRGLSQGLESAIAAYPQNPGASRAGPLPEMPAEVSVAGPDVLPHLCPMHGCECAAGAHRVAL